jgi:hypothetical protein
MPPNVIQLLLEKASTLRPTLEQAASFEAILTYPSSCGNEIGPALKWARSTKDLAVHLPPKNGDLIQQMSLPLLVWGIRQPWAGTISASSLINFWSKPMGRSTSPAGPPLEETVMNLAWATRAIRLVAQDPLANRVRAEDFCREWSYHCEAVSSLWVFESVNTQRVSQLYDAWIDLARIALPELRNLSNPKETLQGRWQQHIHRNLKRMPTAQQSDFLRYMLSSNLSDELKRTTCKKAPPLSWLDPSLHADLRPLLPVLDHTCYPQLPWMELKSHVSARDVCYANESIAHLYCPTLVPAFNLMLRPSEWTDRAAVIRVANMTRPGKPVPEEVSIGDLLI